MPFVRHEHATDAEELFDIAVAQTKTAIQPHGMADDFSRKAVILVSIGGGWCVHATNMPYRENPQQVDNAQNVHLPLQPDESCGISEHYMDSTTQLCYARVAPLADAVITLSCPGPAHFWPGDVPGEPLAPHPTGNAVCNYPSSMLFAPAVSVPLMSVSGMPVGVPRMGQQHDDACITAMACWLLETVPPRGGALRLPEIGEHHERPGPTLTR